MKPYYEDSAVKIFHGDCREIVPTLGIFDLLLTDPPYGIALDTDNSRFSGGTTGNMAKRGNGPGVGAGVPVFGDDEPFDPSWLTALADKSIIWGWHCFPDKLPRGSCLVWIKRNDAAFGSFLSDAETAWFSRGHGVYCRRDLSNNAIANERVHPTQKPLSLMTWCIGLAGDVQTILDPFAGSCTTARAAKDLGRKCVCIEREERYCEIGAKRISQEVLNL
jgi:site-specific DNA-methyltransferase (adenine-specific)/modification methylase